MMLNNNDLKALNIYAEYQLDVPFFDLDPMNIVWHGNYIKYFEEARCQLLRVIDYDYPQMKESGYYWPIIDIRLKYTKPAKYGHRLRCVATLIEFENRLKINYTIFDANTEQKLCKGYSIQVAVTTDNFDMQLVSPPILQKKIERFAHS